MGGLKGTFTIEKKQLGEISYQERTWGLRVPIGPALGSQERKGYMNPGKIETVPILVKRGGFIHEGALWAGWLKREALRRPLKRKGRALGSKRFTITSIRVGKGDMKETNHNQQVCGT